VARFVSSGEVVAGPSHSASGVHDRTDVSKLVCSLAPPGPLCETIARVRLQTCPNSATAYWAGDILNIGNDEGNRQNVIVSSLLDARAAVDKISALTKEKK
jgi:hypothetical protein